MKRAPAPAADPAPRSNRPVAKRPMSLGVVGRRPELPALVAASIMREIAERRLKPGDRLPTEHALATSFGVSRNVVREAMARLRSAGTVWSRQGSGFFVSEAPPPAGSALRRSDPPAPCANAFRDLFDAREALEPRIAGLAAERRQDADLLSLEAAMSAMATALYGSRDWLESDVSFHRSLVGATGSELLAQIVEAFVDRLRESLLVARVRPDLARAAECTVSEHEAVLRAVRAGDAPAAATAMRDHLDRARRRLGE